MFSVILMDLITHKTASYKNLNIFISDTLNHMCPFGRVPNTLWFSASAKILCLGIHSFYSYSVSPFDMLGTDAKSRGSYSLLDVHSCLSSVFM